MRRLLVVLGLILIGLGVALFVVYNRTEVAQALDRGELIHVLFVLSLEEDNEADLAGVLSLFPQGRATVILLPRELSLPGQGRPATVAQVYKEGGANSLRLAVAGLLDLPLTYTVEIGPAALSRLVDLLGGLTVVVEERLIYQDHFRNVFIDFLPGEQLLLGERAVDYFRLTLRYEGGPALTRATSAIRTMVEVLWSKPRSVWEGLQGLLDLCPTDLSAWEARDLLTRLRAVPSEAVDIRLVPYRLIEATVIPDPVKIRSLSLALFAGKTFWTRDEVRLTVLNGSGERFRATSTAAWLGERGFRVVEVGNADRYDYPKTYLLVGPGAQEKLRLLLEVVPSEVVVMAAEEFGMERLGGWPEGVDLILIVGRGFNLGS